MLNRNRNILALVASTAGVVTIAAGTAIACPMHEQEAKGADESLELVEGATTIDLGDGAVIEFHAIDGAGSEFFRVGDKSSSSTVNVIINDNGNTYRVLIEDGDISAWVDGDKLPASRVKRNNDGVVLLGRDGKAIRTIYLNDGTVTFGKGAPRSAKKPRFPRSPQTPRADADQGKSRRGLIGVNVETISADEAESLGLEEGEGIRITGVREGFPADYAGIVEGDIIIGIKGEGAVGTGELIRFLGNKAPGDKVKLVVIHNGEKEVVALKLKADSPEVEFAFEVPGVDDDGEWIIEDDGGAVILAPMGRNGRHIEDRRLLGLTKLLGEIEEGGYVDSGVRAEELAKRLHERAQRWEERNGDRLRLHTEKLELDGEKLRQRLAEMQNMFKDGDFQFFVPDGFDTDVMDERFEAMEDRLEEALEKMEERLEGITERIEDHMDDLQDRLDDAIEEIQDSLDEQED